MSGHAARASAGCVGWPAGGDAALVGLDFTDQDGDLPAPVLHAARALGLLLHPYEPA